EFSEDGEIVRDEHGIAAGGIRLPAADVPVAVNSMVPLAPGIFPLLQGSSVPFSAEKVRSLYADEATYASKVEDVARRAEKSGAVLPRDVDPLIAEAIDEYRRVLAG
ncbi:MAG TPA: alpha/beta hydrolase domain-containing protein, partial [Acidimicrobiales bacterium]|nr:alpha/beta hydrolase domain-containing protein [Acidimicrobiales bacterium]